MNYLHSVNNDIANALRDALNVHQHNVKWYATILNTFEKDVENVPGGGIPFINSAFVCDPQILRNDLDIHEQINDCIDQIVEKTSEFVSNGSGYSYRDIQGLEIHTATYDEIGGSSHIVTPPRIALTHSVVNIQNKEDNMCFAYSILAHIHPAKTNVHRVTNYTQYLNELNMTGI